MKHWKNPAVGLLVRVGRRWRAALGAVVMLGGACAPAWGQGHAGRVVAAHAGDVPGEIQVTATIEATYPLNGPATLGNERGTGPGALHSNITNFSGLSFLNGGATGSGGSAITRLIASEIFLSAPGSIARIKPAIINTSSGTVQARVRPRFYNPGGPSGPGTIIIGFTSNAIGIPPGVSVLSFEVAPFSLPGHCWAGVVFDGVDTMTTGAALNTLGLGLFNPADIGDISGVMFRSSVTGSFLSSNPAGTQSSPPGGAGGWELRSPQGACCFASGSCAILDGAACLNQGGVFRGAGVPCSVCAAAVNFLHDPPQQGFYYALDQISGTDLASPNIQPRGSQQVASVPPSNLNVAYIDEFTIPAPRVIARVDSLVSAGVGQSLPPPGGWLMSIWASPSAAVADPSLEGNTIYDQGYTVPLVFRGGGEYDLVSLIGVSNPLNAKGLATQTNPDIAFAETGPPEPDERGITPSGPRGLVLPAGTYYISVMHRGPAGFSGSVLDSTAQDPRFPPNNGFRVNPGGGVFGGGIQQVNLPASFRVMARFCQADFNGDGSVNTQDLTAFLSNFGVFAPEGSPYDLNADSAVNVMDLTVLLGRFGMPCR